MQTIQQVIKDMDPKLIEKEYLRIHPIEIPEENSLDDVTIGEIKNNASDQLQTFIDKISNIKQADDADVEYVLFVHKSVDDYNFTELVVSLVDMEDLECIDDMCLVTRCGYCLTDWAEAASFLVADNKLTQDNLITLVVEFIYELTWFGFNEEDMKQKRNELEELAELAEAERDAMFNNFDERSVSKDDENELGEEEDPNEERLLANYCKVRRDLEDYSWCNELEQILKNANETP